MPSGLDRLRTRAFALAFPAAFRLDSRRDDLIRLGTEYGGWWVPSGLLTADSVCYCAGVGLDISFDLGLIATFGCRVWAFDPTPASVAWVTGQQLDERFSFAPVGVAGQDGHLRFYAPADSTHVSHSVKNLQRTEAYFTAPVRTVSALMADLGHKTIDLLKLDVEGAEHETIRGVLADGYRPTIVCVEFDQPEPLAWAWDTTRRLRSAGYDLVKVDCFNLTFVHRDAASPGTRRGRPVDA